CKTKGFEPYECSVTVENEADMLKAVEEVKAAGCNALTDFGNVGGLHVKFLRFLCG
ncbi:hypothetical protein H6B10_16835, partial [Gemmiger formicilis]|nr:hypothetical protein [Gemmiger formicilis]